MRHRGEPDGRESLQAPAAAWGDLGRIWFVGEDRFEGSDDCRRVLEADGQLRGRLSVALINSHSEASDRSAVFVATGSDKQEY